MENIYADIAGRTGGNIYIGVVGPVRTGKSTFIKRFMETQVIPNIENVYRKERARDELPQSGSGRTIMTAEPKFVPEEAAQIQLEGGAAFSVRLIDCVGYMIKSANAGEEKIFQKVEAYIHRLAKVEDIKYVDEAHKTLKQSASTVVSNSKIIVPLAGLIDLNEEIKRQNKKLEKLLAEKNSLLARTNNEKFMANAKPELIEQTKNRIEELTVQENAINELIDSLKD